MARRREKHRSRRHRARERAASPFLLYLTIPRLFSRSAARAFPSSGAAGDVAASCAFRISSASFSQLSPPLGHLGLVGPSTRDLLVLREPQLHLLPVDQGELLLHVVPVGDPREASDVRLELVELGEERSEVPETLHGGRWLLRGGADEGEGVVARGAADPEPGAVDAARPDAADERRRGERDRPPCTAGRVPRPGSGRSRPSTSRPGEDRPRCAMRTFPTISEPGKRGCQSSRSGPNGIRCEGPASGS